LSDSRVTKIPRNNTNDEQPMWIGDTVYYLTDKRGPVGLNSYNVSTGRETEVIKGDGFDLKSATAGPGGIAYERLGSIAIYDLNTHSSHTVPVSIHGDFLGVRSKFKNVAYSIDSAAISPSGARVAVTARGWVLTAPASKGDVHLLSEEQGVHRREVTWSPNGKTVAYFTDEKGVQQLALYDAATGTKKLMDLGEAPGYYYGPVWSPDSNKVGYFDNKTQLWFLDIKSGKNTKVDATVYNNPRKQYEPAWSPDSKWLTWSRDLENHLYAVFVYNVDTGKKSQITDGLADANSPVFDKNGKYLYFTASTDVGQASSWLDLSSLNSLNSTSSVYAIGLKKDEADPLHPESDEETPKPEVATPPVAAPQPGQTPAKPAPAPVPPPAKPLIDLDDIEHRIIVLPMPHTVYAGLAAGPVNSVFAMASPALSTAVSASGIPVIYKFSFDSRTSMPFAPGASGIQVTPDGSKALLQMGRSLQTVPTAMPAQPGAGSVNLSELNVKIDPRAEWQAMYHEVWRGERILFYSPTINGIDVNVMEKRYEPFLKNIQSRNDLNYLFIDMLGELCVGHEFPGGGDLPESPQVPGGLLGADYAFEHGRYRLARIYDGERWNPGLRAPLAQPGINAKVGEYLLAIDGKDLTDATDVYEALEGKAGKQVKVKLGPNADGKDSREVTVVPVANEVGLRSRAWEEDNRRYVAEKTGGRGGYVHVPDTAQGGWVAFNRYYYAQVGKDGILVDERFNHGGLINDFMIREMQKPLIAAFAPRYGKDWPTPGSAIYGPKVMLINQFSGSGGDMFPWLFRREKVGRLIGKRTWGGLIAAISFGLIDNGRVNSPDYAFYDPYENKWDVENWGVAPDQEVELDPYLWRQGHDAQLDAGIAELNKELAGYKQVKLQRPPYPDRTKLDIRY
jgi:tricorn protease